MTIDEAIEELKSENGYYANNGMTDVSEFNTKIIRWMEELKDYRDKNKMVVRVDVENMDSIRDKIEELSRYAESQYNKAIDDFVKAIVDRGLSANDDKYCITHYDNYLKVIKKLAEQLKAGGINETN